MQDAYFAGIFDGEGSVTMHYRKCDGNLSCLLCVTNTHLGVLQQLQARFGGSVVGDRGGASGRNRKVWRWQVCGPTSDNFARAIIPYTVIKTEQLVHYLDTRSRYMNLGRVGDDVRALRESAAHHMKQLRRVIV